jgi:2,4-dienoyl-CoA reductase-like NADH-dependent reductase (Old Yellow Enzyme family)
MNPSETMAAPLSRLFEPVSFCGLPAKNRFFRAAVRTGTALPDGSASEAFFRRYAELASGEVGTILTEHAWVHPEGRAATRQWSLARPGASDEVRRLSRSCRDRNALLFVQLSHAGASRSALGAEGEPLTGPSEGIRPEDGRPIRALSIGEISAILEAFAAAATLAKEGGADGVEIHGAHGYLLTQFLSPLTNRRTDRYGGDFRGRSRIYPELLETVRGAVGPGFPVTIKLSIDEGLPGGYTSEEGLALAEELLREGLDAVEVSAGSERSAPEASYARVGISSGPSEAPFAPFARELRRRVGGRGNLVLTGGLRSLPVLARLAREEIADLFGLARPLIAEPDLVARWREEDPGASACISCNACAKTLREGETLCPVVRTRIEGTWDPLRGD